ncbi:MAG: insulinase family protein [Pseudoduganella sp.]|nr:insulinase family protein [Pseudoduganella sp.]
MHIRIVAALLLTASTSFAQTLPAGVAKGPSVEGITEYRLPNGLKVLLFPDASKPTVTVNVTYLVGSRHENYGETGMAHLLEHLMFKGAPRHRNIPQQFSERGMDYNGTTSLDRTNYYEVFQASPENLKWALDMEAERMTKSFIAKKDLDSEMTVVRNEYESGENSPFEVLYKRMESIAYDWHSYGRSTIGNRSDIENVRIENLQAFYRTYYQPDNAVLLVAGKFDASQTLSWISKTFGAIPKPKRKLPQFWTVEPTQDGERSFAVRRKGDVQIVLVGYKIPSGLHPDADPLAFMNQVLGDTPNGRLHKQLVESGKAAQVFAFSQPGFAPSLQVFGAVVKMGQPVEPVRDELIAAVEGFAKAAPSAEEMERARREFSNAIEKALNNPQQVGVALSEHIALGDWRLLFQGRDGLGAISAAQVAESAGRYLKRDNRVVGHFVPDDAPQRAEIGAAPTAAELLKDYRGKAGALTSEVFDPSQDNIMARTELAQLGGLKLALLPKRNRGETVALDLRLHWGDEKNQFGQQVVAAAADQMLTRGTSKYSRAQLADAMSKLKMTGSLYQFETTREHLAAALRLQAHVLKEPAFPAAEFEQMRQQWLVGLEASRNDPQAMAGRALAEYFDHWPKGDPRSVMTLDEQVAAIKALKLEDVKAYHAAFYGASRGELSVVGDFDKAELVKVAGEELAGWQSKASYAPILDRHVDKPATRVTLDAPDKENGMFAARLNIALRTDHPDYPALELANFIFGDGGLKSRLMDRIRQKDGLSYGGGSALDAGDLDDAGGFTIEAIAAPQNMVKLEAAIRQELERAVKQGFTAAEVAGAKSGLMQQRLQNRSKDDVLAGAWSRFRYLGRTFLWSKEHEAKLKALTAQQVSAAFRKHIDPARLSVVIASDAAKAKR